VDYRTKLERWVYAVSNTWHYKKPFVGRDGAHGLGRLGADFWNVVKVRGVPSKSLAGFFPESYWGQLNINYCVPTLLGKGKHGAVPTVRSESFRENVQEVEARIFIEKAVLAEEARLKLNNALKDRKVGAATPEVEVVAEAVTDTTGSQAVIGKEMVERARAVLDKRIRMGLHCEGEGRAWFIASDWNRRNEELFQLAADIARKLKK
jgi:hypothetical protein